jgi:hypothetical protein
MNAGQRNLVEGKSVLPSAPALTTKIYVVVSAATASEGGQLAWHCFLMAHDAIRYLLASIAVTTLTSTDHGGHGVDTDTLPVRFKFPVFIFQKDDSVVWISIRHNHQDPTVVVQEADALLDHATNVDGTSGAAKDGIKGPLANNQIKGSILEGQRRTCDIMAQEVHALPRIEVVVAKDSAVIVITVTLLHLVNDNLTKIHLHKASLAFGIATSPSSLEHIGSEVRVATSQDKDATVVWVEAVKGLGVGSVGYGGSTSRGIIIETAQVQPAGRNRASTQCFRVEKVRKSMVVLIPFVARLVSEQMERDRE